MYVKCIQIFSKLSSPVAAAASVPASLTFIIALCKILSTISGVLEIRLKFALRLNIVLNPS